MGGSEASGHERRADLLVRDAELVVTMTGDEIRGGWVAIEGGSVQAVGRPGEEPEAAETLSARGCLVTPGLVNTHHHMFQNLTRSFRPVTNRDFIDWWRTLGEHWKDMDEEASYISTWIALAELALGGCTTTTDHLYIHPRPKLVDAQIVAAREVGLRFHPARGAMDLRQEDGGTVDDVHVQDRDTILSDFARLIATYHDPRPGAMIQIALGPCQTFDSSPALFREAAELAERLGVRLHTHLAATPAEDQYARERYGRRTVDLFEEWGWASSHAWVAHGVFLDTHEIGRLAGWGTGVSHCPSSNMLISHGIAPVPELRQAGVHVGLGCDGSASTDHGSLWLEAHTALLLARVRTGPTTLSARDVLEMATIGSAACLGREGQLGVLRPGAGGDLVAWSLGGIAYAGAWTDPVEAWLRCGPTSAHHTVVAGKVIVRGGELQLPNVEEQLRLHAQVSRAWQGVEASPRS